jgi:hypothetical protein
MARMTDRKSPIEQALDLFFYAPLGFVLNAQEVVPELIEKGHQQVVMARMFGKFAIESEAPKQIAELQKQVQKVAEQFTARAVPGRASSNGPVEPAAPATQTSAPVVAPPSAAPAHGPGAAALAITDYDSLSASQVVPRLEGLSGDELVAVREYESAHRGRKTILSKIAQLQG